MYRKTYSALWGASKSDFFSKIIEKGKRYIVISDDYHLEKIGNELNFFLSKGKFHFFHPYYHEPFERARILPKLSGNRITTLLNIKNSSDLVLLTNLYGITKYLPPYHILNSSIIEIARGKKFNRDELIYYLEYIGYIQVEIVTGAGEFSFRGDIVDLFPVNADNPLRIEFFDDEIERIAIYSTETQKRLGDLSEYKIIPASEGIYDASELKNSVKNNDIIDKIDLYGKFAGHHWYAPYVYKNMETVFDYIESFEIVFFGDDLEYEIDKFYNWMLDCSREYGVQDELINLNFINKKDLLELFNRSGVVRLTDLVAEDSTKLSNYSSSNFIFNKKGNMYSNMANLAEFFQKNRDEKVSTVLSVESERTISSIKDFMRDYEIQVIEVQNISEVSHEKLCIYNKTISDGFIDKKDNLSFLKDEDIFGFSKKGKKKSKKEVFRTSISDLENGDYVVHIDYGIGIFRGLENKTIGGVTGDFISIEYENGEILYVSLENISMIQKYVGVGDKTPKLSSLQSVKWKKMKEQAEKSAKKIAIDLLKLYAERKAKKGFSFKDDGELLRTIEESFEYDETEDQFNAIRDVLRDMESDKVMDRLVCGDVGFGKTEVAIRAACKACASGKQVGLLAPTTILVRQHYETFKKRFKNTPVKIDFISRFKTKSEIAQTLRKLSSGEIDILIGTHRLLSSDVEFRDLGLLIIDEEQRFGVAHKEKIKNIKSNIDVLAMSATPIPRTLQLSLAGIRDISIIDTPPEDRLPVITNIISKEDEVKNSILHELKRSGQVYYLYNDLDKIEEVAFNIKNMLPEARVEIAHGQMESNKVEKILENFYSGEIDILVASTIIENGLDVPNVNTIIIDNADRFGLSQLYQLKGRVGRSDKRGYCYLLIRNFNTLSSIAKKRLKIIQQMSELGSGFKIASYDLQLRGAGEMLGAEQSGHISSIGYELYIQMINNAIKELQGEDKENIETEIQSVFPFFIPADYIVDPSERIWWYGRFDRLDCESFEEIKEELHKNYGEPPEVVLNTILIMNIKKISQLLAIKKVVLMNKQFKLYFDNKTPIDPSMLLSYIKGYNLKAQFIGDNIFLVNSENTIDQCLSLLKYLIGKRI